MGSLRSTLRVLPQPDGYPDLEVLPFPMYTPNYRIFTDHDALVFNHDVNTPDDRVGRRWYEIRSPLSATPPVIYQQGTFAPDDGLNRWMGSAALDFSGNIAMGYSVSSSSVYPSIRYTGRLASDPLGEMAQGEATLIDGTGSQDGGAARWGDYSSMVTDPTDECTFWYTTEYIETTGLATWQTRIGAFKFPSCSIGPTGSLEGTVSDGTNPIAGATVTAGAASTTDGRRGALQLRAAGRHLRHDGVQVRILPGHGRGRSGHRRWHDDAGLRPRRGALADRQRRGPGRFRRQLAPLRQDPDQRTRLPGLHDLDGSGHGLLPGHAGGRHHLHLRHQRGFSGLRHGGGPLPLGVPVNAPFVVHNWFLTADNVSCVAPGYSPTSTASSRTSAAARSRPAGPSRTTAPTAVCPGSSSRARIRAASSPAT